MIKLQIFEEIILGKFDELKNIKRANLDKNEKGYLYVNDTFECDEKMADYLTGNNPINRAVARVLEVIPERENIKTTTHRRKKSVAKD